jgi:Nucleotidyl transferase AbiEii toxin, Type IV TA system
VPRGHVANRKKKNKVKRRSAVPGGLTEAIHAVSIWLSDAGVGFAIVGGVAASLHGRPRVTKDVDVVVMTDDDTWGRLLELAADHGLHPRIPDALQFARTTRVLLLVHRPSHIEVDVSFGALPFELEIVQRATIKNVGRVSFPLASAEDIVIMKAIAMRPRDVADIEGILESVPDLDLDRVRKVVSQLSAALEAEDHLTRLDEIVRGVLG